MITVPEIEKIIGIPTDDWKGHCYFIACELIKHGIFEGRAVHGMYFGEIVKTSMFYNKATAFARHGWIETPNGNIIDPTRWVFEDEEPYIFTGDYSAKEYDEGGSVIREMLHQPQPKHNPDSKQFDIPENKKGANIRMVLDLPPSQETVSIEEVFWLANCPLSYLGKQAKMTYEALIDWNLKAFVPADHQVKVLELKKW